MAQTPPVDAHEARDERDARQARLNRELHGLDADEVVRRTLQAFDGESDGVALTTSFGIQSAVMLHLVTRHKPNIPVIWIDTGYLPPETYQYAELLTRRLNLNLRVFQPGLSAARMEATLGPELWASDHAAYGRLRKVQPMARALGWLQARARAQAGEAAGEAAGDAAPLPCIFTGLRAAQTQHRQTMHLVNVQRTPMPHFKVCPLLHWTQADVAAYFSAHDLPHHPLEAAGYTTVGDVHSSAPAPPPGAGAEAGADAAAAELAQRGTRFGGRAQECGLHVDDEEGGAGGAALVPAAMDLEG